MNKISVCIATFNGQLYVKDQIISILHQLKNEDEVIVSDDSSTDKTIEEIKSINDKRIKIFCGPGMGPIPNFENALMRSQGDVVILSDQDDVWLEDKLNTILTGLMTSNLVITDCYVVDANLEIINKSFFLFNNSKSGLLNNLFKNGYLGCCMGMNRCVLEFALPFPKHIPMHDWWLGLSAEILGGTKFINEICLLYRRHGSNFSQTSQKSTTSFLQKIRWRLYLGCMLILRLLEHKIKL
jgi:glycosyltransferase involved in cell wall biosynthesis